MFGYVVVNKPEMKIREFEIYHSYYCGLCRELREKYGIPGQVSLTFDMTFVLILLSGLYEPMTQKGKTNCVIHPLVKQEVRRNTYTEYAADMNVLLTYYKCLDDWTDDRDFVKRGYAQILRHHIFDLEKKYPRQSKEIREGLKRLSDLEQKRETDLDLVAGCFGEILGSILACKDDFWEDALRRLGFYLGKYIYILDAYEDLEKDQQEGNYNPFLNTERGAEFEENIRNVLTLMASETCRQYEHLPVIRYQEILGNILYSGIWTKYFMIQKKRRKDEEKKHD